MINFRSNLARVAMSTSLAALATTTFVDETQDKVYCLARAPGAEAIVETHREAHGLLPTTVGPVSEGE